MFIGIDDTDSERGLCTTYLAAVLMDRLQPLGEIVGRPRLIRLNPCARFKTRGNAALAFQIESQRAGEVKDTALKPSPALRFPEPIPILAGHSRWVTDEMSSSTPGSHRDPGDR